MAWRLIYFDSYDALEEAAHNEEKFAFDVIGAVYPNPRLVDDESIAPNYVRDWKGKRAPLVVVTPGGPWCLDCRAFTSEQGYHGSGWTVTGDVPNLTASPSINQPGRYHGFLQNGILTDDCEGRQFPQFPATA